MGSSFKGSANSHGHGHIHGHGHRGKPYGLMLLLAFGAAILGVMVLHKLRERRIFALLVKEKDHDLLTLHLLLQREKEFNKEARKKIEEMKTKVYSLRSHKLEMDRRLMEMEATVSSMRDERKVIESALEEKNDISMMLTERATNLSSDTNPQVAELNDMVETKEDLKLRSQMPANPETEEKENDKVPQQNSNSTSISTNGEYGSAIKIKSDSSTGKAHHELNHVLVSENLENKVQDSQSSQSSKIMEQQKNRANYGSPKARHGSDSPSEQESQGYKSFNRGGLKLEQSDRSEQGLVSRVRRKHSKGKRWRVNARNRRFGSSLYSAINGAGALKEDQSASSEKQNQAFQETLSGEEKREQSYLEIKWLGTEGGDGNAKTELVSDGDQIARVGQKNSTQKTEENNNQRKDGEENGKQEKVQKVDVKEHENENEQAGRAAEKDEAEAEELEDAEIHEPEMDRADIKRFSESDQDEGQEETEF